MSDLPANSSARPEQRADLSEAKAGAGSKEQAASPAAGASGAKGPKKGDPRIIVNLPNALTALRLVLCIAFFGILIYAKGRLDGVFVEAGDTTPEQRGYRELVVALGGGGSGHLQAVRTTLSELYQPGPDRGLALLFDIAFAIFFLAAITDTLDGQIARRWGLETDFGRIADPFVDKIMIIGALVLLMPLTVYIAGWMVVLVLARELLVSGLRGFAESRGVAFPTSFWGKTKMVSQTLFVGASVLYIGHPEVAWWRDYFFIPLLWLAIATTVLSGVVYLTSARKVMSLARAAAGGPA